MCQSSRLNHDEHPVATVTASSTTGREWFSTGLLWGALIAVLFTVGSLGIWSLITQQSLIQLVTARSTVQLPVYGTVPDFRLVERSGRPVQLEDLLGKVWIANFIFTHCPDECPLMTAEMAQMQVDFAAAPDLRFLSITVDPDRDTPAMLSQYAAQFQADPQRWLFLTGDKRAIYRLAQEGFRLGISLPPESSQGPLKRGHSSTTSPSAHRSAPSLVQALAGYGTQGLRSRLAALAPAQAFADHGRLGAIGHSTRFVLIDRQARIRGYYDSLDEAALQRLRRHVHSVLRDS